MRSTNKQINKLLDEVKKTIGCKSRNEAMLWSTKAKKSFENRLKYSGITAIQLSPYRNGQWELSGIKSGHWVSMAISVKEMFDTRTLMAKRFVAHFSS